MRHENRMLLPIFNVFRPLFVVWNHRDERWSLHKRLSKLLAFLHINFKRNCSHIQMIRMISSVDSVLDYQASSPDEKALVEACAHLGMVYMGDVDDVLHLRSVPSSSHLVAGVDIFYRRLHVLEFTSERKRMSVIVQDQRGIKWILTKGAESHVFPLCASTQTELIDKTDAHIGEFARSGLRTLVLARRRLTEPEYQEFCSDLLKANQSLEHRKDLCQRCYEKLETGKCCSMEKALAFKAQKLFFRRFRIAGSNCRRRCSTG